MQIKLKILLQYLVPTRALSWLTVFLCENHWHWWKSWQINFFIRKYEVNLSEAVQQNSEDYPTFNSFFTRALKPELRPIVQGSNQIACPVDGAVSQIGKIEQETLLQAKGFYYTLTSLLGGFETHAKTFAAGHFATLYLAPKDYHRIHMPITGTLRETIYIPGKLFCVNPFTAENIPQLFSRNERLVCLFDTERGPMAVILVGAMLVGGIQTVWSAEKTYPQTIKSTLYPNPVTLERGAELGRFNMGSTVIVLFTQDKVEWSQQLAPGTTLKMGQLIGQNH